MRRALATRPCTRPQMLAANQMLLTRREPQHMFLVYFCPPRSTSSATHSITNSALATSALLVGGSLGRPVLVDGLHVSRSFLFTCG